MIIKIVLLAGLLVVAIYASRGKTGAAHLAARRLLGGAVLALGALSVVSPLLVTRVANLVGVKRGTDLMLYIFVVASLLIWVSMYRRLAELDRRLAIVTRQLTLQEAAATTPSSKD